MSYTYPSHGVTVDGIIFGYNGRELQLVLIRRAIPPFEGQWALPGGFVLATESLDEAIRRELREETSLHDLYLEQLYTFGNLNRDPRGRVISVAYYALVRPGNHPVGQGSDAAEAKWFNISELPTLAFDHGQIIQIGLERLRGKVSYAPIGFELLPKKFTFTQLQHLYEAILGRALDKRNFRKKFQSLGLVKELKEKEVGVAHRAAQLYRFETKTYEKLAKTGFGFRLI